MTTISHLYGVARGAEALVLAERFSADARAPLVYIAPSDREREAASSVLRAIAPEITPISFPAWDCLPYDRASPHPALVAERMEALAALTEGNETGTKPLVLTTVNAVLQRVPPRLYVKQATREIRTGTSLNRDALVAFLVRHGYRQVGKVAEPGEYALRGGLMDVLPPGANEGIRIDWFGDEVESLRRFDPLAQTSSGTLTQFRLLPVSEVPLDEAGIDRFREGYRTHFGAVTKEDPLYEAVSGGRFTQGIEHFLPLFYERMDSLLDYLPGARLVLHGETRAAMEEHEGLVRDYYEARKHPPVKSSGSSYHPLPPELLYLPPSFLLSPPQAGTATTLLHPFPPANAGQEDAGYRPGRNFAAERHQGKHPLEALAEAMRARTENDAPTLLACYSEGSRERMAHLLAPHAIPHLSLARFEEAYRLAPHRLGLAVCPLEYGFSHPKLTVLSESDVLGERLARPAKRKRKPEQFLAEAAGFTPGELVVHREHGIGRFDGLVTLTVEQVRHDCLKLVYAENARLFLPVENLDLITRYGADAEGVELDRLGGVAWQARAAKLKERITLAAEALMKTAAERLMKPAERLTAPDALADEFAARFPYMETEDQARAIEDATNDLAAGRPMDRLICGDVGFGKTEVALRAAYAAVSGPAKKQVAVICPTTLLARQHLKNFEARFEGFPVTVRGLSRLTSAKDAAAAKQGLKDGSVDIAIGTHALLADAVAFARLGLLIIDEEQHFGVAQKEKLKSLKADVHVLTLSATPIPRTLQLALTGVRDLSLITTPPVDRLAVRTFVLPWDPVTLREALLREHHRGGKSFVVTPRIAGLAELEHELKTLAPELSFAVAHGQMGAVALDKIMNDFYDGKYDALISTSIVESGLDVPTANTLIIHQAHRFGLSQLYQLRGRVGRSKTRAYAYFTLPHGKLLTQNATRRLEVMQSLDHLGAGFTLASHDMDIRGFGNLVGEEQSGHIREVGIELYQQMLQEAVEAIKHKANASPSAPTGAVAGAEAIGNVTLNLGLSVLIPESYVPDLELRMGLYRRATQLEGEPEIDAFAAELADRFGALPEEVEHLLFVMKLKQLCRRLNIEKIDLGPKGAVIGLRHNRFPNPDALMRHVLGRPREWKPRPDQKLLWLHEAEGTKAENVKAEGKRLHALHRVLRELEKLL